MSQKRELKNYIKGCIKKGYSKEQIKNALLKVYKEEDFKKILVQFPEPALKAKYNIWNNILIFLLVIPLLIKVLVVIKAGIEAGAGLGVTSFITLIVIIINIIFITAIIQNRAWVYPLLIIFSVYGLRSQTDRLIDNIVGLGWSLGVILLSFFIWFKVHPDYLSNYLLFFKKGKDATDSSGLLKKIINLPTLVFLVIYVIALVIINIITLPKNIGLLILIGGLLILIIYIIRDITKVMASEKKWSVPGIISFIYVIVWFIIFLILDISLPFPLVLMSLSASFGIIFGIYALYNARKYDLKGKYLAAASIVFFGFVLLIVGMIALSLILPEEISNKIIEIGKKLD